MRVVCEEREDTSVDRAQAILRLESVLQEVCSLLFFLALTGGVLRQEKMKREHTFMKDPSASRQREAKVIKA